MEGFLLLQDSLSELPDGVQRGKVHQAQVDVSVPCFLPDLFERRRPPGLAAAGQDNTGSTPGKVQGNELPDP